MSKYIFSLIFLFFCETLFSQELSKDSIVQKKNKYGLRVGTDLSKIARNFYEKDYRGLEIVGDFRIRKNHYLAAEIGNENKTVLDSKIDFTTQGSFIKVGFDYNAFENWTGMNNLIYLGMRYGFSSFSQTRNSFTIYNPDHTFAPEIVLDGTKFSGLSAQWVEVIGGIKVETIKNLYLGANVQLHFLTSQNQPENFENLYIPGFNKTYSGKFGTGFTYTISYLIPLFKK